ncbi:MAG TPA: hypothetical protein PK530_21765 [Anaerolineales bacterium]|nr:hypothetical protein [Anaerolineales bacterium]
MNSSTNVHVCKMMIGLGAFVVMLIISVIITRLTPWYAGNWDTVIMLLPIFPGIYAGVSLARGIRTMDEMQQRIQLEAFSFSLANTAFFSLLLGLMQANSSVNINLVWVIPIMAGFWGLGLWFAQRRYQ